MTDQLQTAIVTGGTGALGSVLTRTMLDEGYHVAVPYRDQTKADRLTQSAGDGRKLFLFQADLSQDQPAAAFINSVMERFGSVRVLIHAAGGYFGGKLVEETEPSDWNRMISDNLRSAYLMCRGVLPGMRRERFGRIVTIASMPAVEPSARSGAYAVAKGGLITLTEVLAEEVRGSGITINAIAPSIILTDENRKSMPKADVSAWVTPREIAQLVLYLISEEARSVNGSVIKTFGGL